MKVKWKGKYIFTEGFNIRLYPNIEEEIDDDIAKRLKEDYGDLIELIDEKSGFHKCDKCDFIADTPQGLASHMKTHKKVIKKNTKKKVKK